MHHDEPAVWFPAVRAGTGVDVFTETLALELQKRGLHAEITWLPLRAEYVPWTVFAPDPPRWATVVHTNTWLHPRFIPDGLPLVATVHHSVHLPDLEPYKGRLRSTYHRQWIRRVERATMGRADRVVAVSRFAAATARATLLDRPIDVIPNGVHIDCFREPERRKPHQPFRLLFVGGWKKIKGVDLLASIMRELGGGFELRYTRGTDAIRDSVGMPSNMHDIGRLRTREAVAQAMQDSDALLFPSRAEGFGLVVAEAMACGLPVIATDGTALSEIVEDGVTGILCPQEDILAFAEAARILSGDPALAGSMSLAARQRAVSQFSIDRVVDAYVSIYMACIDRRR